MYSPNFIRPPILVLDHEARNMPFLKVPPVPFQRPSRWGCRKTTDNMRKTPHIQEHLLLHESDPHPKFLSGRILLIMSAICDDMIIFEVQSLSY